MQKVFFWGVSGAEQNNKLVRWGNVFKNRFTGAEVNASSVNIAYYLLLSLFPLAIVAGNILPLFNITPTTILPYIDALVPETVQPVLDPIIADLLAGASGGLLSISAVGLVWSASRGMTYMQRGMNKAYGVVPQGGLVVKRGISLVMVLLILILMVGFIFVFSIGQMILNQLAVFFPGAAVIDRYLSDFKWPTTLLAVFVVLLAIYRVMPDVKLKLRQVWPGALLATGGIMLLTQLFTIYMRFSASRFSGYGTLGTFFVLMFWLNFCCMLLLAGAVLNASIREINHGPAQAVGSRIDNFLKEHVVDRALGKAQRKWDARRVQKAADKLDRQQQELDNALADVPDTAPPRWDDAAEGATTFVARPENAAGENSAAQPQDD